MRLLCFVFPSARLKFLAPTRLDNSMASREALEESKNLDSSLYHAPTLRPGIGSPRCPRCSAPLSKDLQASGWTIAPFMRESFAMVGTAAGGTLSSFYAFNAVMPHVKKRVGGPIWWQIVVGLPPVLVFSVGCAGLAGGALPALAQLSVSTYHAASAQSHSAISAITMRVEERGTNALMPQSSNQNPSQSPVNHKS